MTDVLKSLGDPEMMDRTSVLIIAVAVLGMFPATWKLFDGHDDKTRTRIGFTVVCFSTMLVLAIYESYFSRHEWRLYGLASVAGLLGTVAWILLGFPLPTSGRGAAIAVDVLVALLAIAVVPLVAKLYW